MTRLRVIALALLAAAAPALATNTAPVRRDVQTAACGGTTPASCVIDLGVTQSDDLITLCCCGQEIIVPEGDGWNTIETDDTGANTAVSMYYKIATDEDEAAGQISVGYETGGNYEMCAMVSYQATTFNAANPIDDHGADSITTTGTSSKTFSIGTASVANTTDAPYIPFGAFPAKVLGCYCASDNGPGGAWASGYQSSLIGSGSWTQLANMTTSLGRDGGLAVAEAPKATAGAWGPSLIVTSSISAQYAAGSFDVAGNPPPTDTPTATATGTSTQTATTTNTPTVTNTVPTPTHTVTPSITATPTDTPTAADTPTNTRTRTPTRTATETPTATVTQTGTITQTPTTTATKTDTPTVTATQTASPQPTDMIVRDANGQTWMMNGATMPEDTGFLACLRTAIGISEAFRCIPVPDPLRRWYDAAGSLVSGNPSANELQHDVTMKSALVGRRISWGQNPDYHQSLIPEQISPLACLKDASATCDIQAVWDFQDHLPRWQGFSMQPYQTFTFSVDVTLDTGAQFWRLSGGAAPSLLDAQSVAKQDCILVDGGISVFVDTGGGTFVVASMPANCAGGVGVVRSSGIGIGVATVVGSSASQFDGGGQVAWLHSEDRGWYTSSAGTGCTGQHRRFEVEAVCGGFQELE